MSTTLNNLRECLGPRRAAEQLFGQQEIYGEGYHKGLDIALAVEKKLEAGDNLESIEPVLFSTSEEQDRGEKAGFNTAFCVGPKQPLEEVLGVILTKYGVVAELQEVNTLEQLLPREEEFMNKERLPAVRVCFVGLQEVLADKP